MELFHSDKYFVLQNDNESLWVNRENGVFSPKTGRELVDKNLTLTPIGKVYGFIGTLRLSAAAEPRLVFIRSQECVWKVKGHEVYKITSVLSVPLESECEVEVEMSPSSSRGAGGGGGAVVDIGGAPTGGTTATTTSSVLTSPLHQAASSNPHTPQHSAGGNTEGSLHPATATFWQRLKIPACPNSKKYGGRQDKTERRLLDEFYKMFVEADSFYHSSGYDIFNSVQRQMDPPEEATAVTTTGENKENVGGSTAPAGAGGSVSQKDKNQNDQLVEASDGVEILWRKADERFFWNRYMLSDIIDSQDCQLHPWAVAVMQGSIQHQVCQLDPNSARVTQNESEEPAVLELVLISRRSRYRAGTRYLRRGVDEEGKVANYVETEQIMIFRGHMISFVQTRGSVPVFWSQPGYKYRPPIRLDKSIDEGFPAFEKHMNEELKTYGSVTAINLVEKAGKEKVLEEAYRRCVLTYNSPNVSYVTFDFHDRCRGLRFDNVKLLTEGVAEILRNMTYCWVDSFGVVMQQKGVFRVNCVDCLDRTNVVQSFLAKEVLSLQLSKVGLLMPEIGLGESIRKKFLEVWANNGDIISKQYAGTNALKGDFTRTGERRFAGVMRDGMNSANRYLNNRLKDGTRQACIDLILGVRSSVTEEELTLGKEEAAEEKEITTELILQMIEDVKHTLVPANTVIVASWGLVNARTNEAGSVEVDTVLVLTEHELFIAIYDCSLDSIASSTKISLSGVTSLEILSDPVVAQHNVAGVWGLFQGSSSSSVSSQAAHVPSLKLHFIMGDGASEEIAQDFFHFRSSNLRFFNNCLTHITHPDEMMEALKMLAETVKAAVFGSCGKVIPITTGVSSSSSTAGASSKSGQRGITGINAWIPRWNTPAAPATIVQGHDQGVAEINRKFSPASMQRFTPNFLKKKRTTTAQPAEEEGASRAHPESGLPQSLKIPSGSSSTANPPVILQQARTPMETSGCTLPELHFDLFLPSVGIISLVTRPTPALPSLQLLGAVAPITPAGGLSPVTPLMEGAASQDVTPTSTDTSQSLRLHIPQDLLQRHRYSLPTNSLTVFTSPSKSSSARSTTPEIRITEEQQPVGIVAGGLTLSVLPGASSLGSTIVNQKRMSRSSEDVNKVAPVSGGIGSSSVKMFNSAFINRVPVSLKNKLVPTLPQDSRSTSDQDIFSSLVAMKGSHSENAIKDGSNSGTGTAPAARGQVFAPLGKLARGMQNIGVNYLDPRKLRDTLRQPRPEQPAQEDPELLEKMKTCKSRIIDI